MSKSRINKLIFQDGKIFLRVKVTARDLKLVRKEFDYTIEFCAGLGKEEFISLPFVFVEGFKAPEGATSKNYSWGQLFGVQTSSDPSEQSYYAQPRKKKFAVKVGPFPSDMENVLFNIDWANIQWGSSENTSDEMK